jgi:hypothetical protein
VVIAHENISGTKILGKPSEAERPYTLFSLLLLATFVAEWSRRRLVISLRPPKSIISEPGRPTAQLPSGLAAKYDGSLFGRTLGGETTVGDTVKNSYGIERNARLMVPSPTHMPNSELILEFAHGVS